MKIGKVKTDRSLLFMLGFMRKKKQNMIKKSKNSKCCVHLLCKKINL